MDSKPSENENCESSDVEECGYSTSTSDESDVELMHKKELRKLYDVESNENMLSIKNTLSAGSDMLKAVLEENLDCITAFLSENRTGEFGTLYNKPLRIPDALYWACYFGYVKSVKLLLQHGANPLKYPRHHLPDGPVAHGACFGGLKVLKIVTEWASKSGCVHRFVNAIDPFTNSTPLHVATKLLDVDMVMYLIRHGADPCAKDIDHRYPFEYAPAGSRLSGVLKAAFMDNVECDMEKRKSHKKQKASGRMKEPTPPAAGSSNPPAAGSSNPPPWVAKLEEISVFKEEKIFWPSKQVVYAC